MPRTSRDALTIVPLHTVEVVQRVKPPPGSLNRDETKEFFRIVDSSPADWFSEVNIATLLEYCRHFVMARELACQINIMTRYRSSFTTQKFQDLVKLRNAETKIINQLMTSMRLTQQSLIEKKTGKHAKEIDMPWLSNGEEG